MDYSTDNPSPDYSKDTMNGVDGVKEGVIDNNADNRSLVLKHIKADNNITIAQILQETGISRRTVDRIIRQLKEKGIYLKDDCCQRVSDAVDTE